MGIVFFIIVFTGIASYVTYSMNHLDKFGQTIIEKSQEDRNRDREEFEITSVRRDSNKFNITVQNTGELPINITRLWIQNKTDPSWGTQKFDINKNVSPGQTLIKVGQDLQLTALSTQGYDIKLVTERGNAKEFLVNSASQEPVYLQLFVLPEEVPNGSTTTVLFAVTNNMSNSGMLTNFKPQLTVTPQGATATYVSGPTPTTYSLLEKGDTAYFEWVYNISGSNGQKVNFKADLENPYLNNYVSGDVTVDVLTGSPTIKTVMGGGLDGTISSTTQRFMRFFGDTDTSTTYGLKNMSMPTSGTFKNLYVSKGTGAVAVTFTLYKNGAPTALTCTTPASTAQTTCSDITNSVSVVAGNHVAMGILAASTTSTGDITFTVEFDPT